MKVSPGKNDSLKTTQFIDGPEEQVQAPSPLSFLLHHLKSKTRREEVNNQRRWAVCSLGNTEIPCIELVLPLTPPRFGVGRFPWAPALKEVPPLETSLLPLSSSPPGEAWSGAGMSWLLRRPDALRARWAGSLSSGVCSDSQHTQGPSFLCPSQASISPGSSTLPSCWY